jgi:uncharacterized protein
MRRTDRIDMGQAIRYVLCRESGDLTRAVELVPAHRAMYSGFMDRRLLLALGPFADRSSSMGVFTTRGAAEEFAAGDPFVRNGVISSWQIRAWHEATPD